MVGDNYLDNDNNDDNDHMNEWCENENQDEKLQKEKITNKRWRWQ